MNKTQTTQNNLTELLVKSLFIAKFILYTAFSICVIWISFFWVQYIKLQKQELEIDIEMKQLEIKEKKFFMKLQEKSAMQSYEEVEEGCSH